MKHILIVILWIFINIKGTSEESGRRSYGRTEFPIESVKESYDNLQNSSVYLSFTNNPFGPSKRLNNKKEKLNTTENEKTYRKRVIDISTLTNKMDYGKTKSRLKRGVIHLYNMVSCATGCNPLSYKGYGCYCGFLGSGYAVDGIDRCCKRHDWCYDVSNCPIFLEYLQPYYWTCFNNRPICAMAHGEYGGYGSCAQRLCECDRVLSECLNQYPCPRSRAICKSSPWRFLQNALMLF